MEDAGPSHAAKPSTDTEYLQVSVPKFDKVPWLSEASLVNKPLVLSIPRRFHSTAMTSPKKDMDSPILFQVPDVMSKAEGNQNESLWFRNKQLCPACREMKMIGTVSLATARVNFCNVKNEDERAIKEIKEQIHYLSNCRMIERKPFVTTNTASLFTPRMMSLHQPYVQKSKPSYNDVPTESIHYRLPILGSRTAVFHGLLSGAYKTLQETQHSPLPKKEQISKTLKQ
ncbi:uncharacterized protein C1orf105 homolog [Nannospalax galili]|uniref:uncharacterized protein C1orf105 homolog n=1 Tax=Nannospalax galili TaxID=1026970 RepID=UPI0004ED437F|nr:uncharacterized protein C1orf105 homolog [Nannospalax galili]